MGAEPLLVSNSIDMRFNMTNSEKEHWFLEVLDAFEPSAVLSSSAYVGYYGTLDWMGIFRDIRDSKRSSTVEENSKQGHLVDQ